MYINATIDTIIGSSIGAHHIRNATQRLPRRFQNIFLFSALAFNDVFMIAFACAAAYGLRFSLSLPLFHPDGFLSIVYYQRLTAFFIPISLFIFYMSGLYKQRNILGGTREYALIVRATSIGILLVIVIGFLNPNIIIARGWLIPAWIFSFLFIGVGRFMMRRIVNIMRKRGYFVSCAIIVGANEEGCALAHQLSRWETSGLYVLGFIDDETAVGTRKFNQLFNIGHSDQIDEIIRQLNVEDIIIITSALPRERIIGLFKKYGMVDNINLHLSSGLYEIVTTTVEVNDILNAPLVHVNRVQLTGIDYALKLLLDYAITIPILIFIFPLLILICLIIKFDSPGPIIYRRRVMGKKGREFFAYKFRTMYTNGDEILMAYPKLKEELERNHKLKEDPRITRVGKFLRQYSLDELPQLLNVLKRQMSIVGPRMITGQEMKMYKKWDTNLLTVNPGITGLWQVSGRSDTSYEERVRLDMEYIRTWTIWSDLYILWSTVPAVLKKKGAY
jgi:exopolysaccharide biosynthesis polyprenyl glycosylphosphotransferase